MSTAPQNQKRLADEESIILRLDFEESQYPLLLSLSSLLYDLELVHDLSVLVSYPQYDNFQIATPYFFYRKGRPLLPEHRARAARVAKQSPLSLEIVIAALGGIWILVQTLEKVSNWSLNREKLRLEIEKLRRENEIKRLELDEKYEARLERRNARLAQSQLANRLSQSEFRLVDASVKPMPRKTE